MPLKLLMSMRKVIRTSLYPKGNMVAWEATCGALNHGLRAGPTEGVGFPEFRFQRTQSANSSSINTETADATQPVTVPNFHALNQISARLSRYRGLERPTAERLYYTLFESYSWAEACGPIAAEHKNH